MGASTALLAARGTPAIGALVTDSAFADIGQIFEHQYRKQAGGLPRCLLPGALLVGRLLTGVDLRRVRPVEAATALRGLPTLVIHSAGDRFVPVSDAHAIAKACGGTLWVTAGKRHIGSYRDEPEAYARRVVAFFGEHLLRAAGSRPSLRPATADEGTATLPQMALPLAA